MKEIEEYYIKEREIFNKVLNVTLEISLNQHGINTDGRGVRGMKIFTRQTTTGISLSKLLPQINYQFGEDDELWDVCSIASLSRNMLEGYLSLHFFGLENITPEEAELRFFILQYHRNIEWYNIRKNEDTDGSQLVDFEEGLPKEKERIKKHTFISKLPETQRKRAIKGIEIYKTKSDFENELTVCKDLRKNYRLLSNLVHPLPLSVERIDNERGRGVKNIYDMNYILLSLIIARTFLAASTVGIADLFSETLGKKYKNEIDSIRGYINENN
nr:hypothetical protein [uncultured Carboxylicivirga sp.]